METDAFLYGRGQNVYAQACMKAINYHGWNFLLHPHKYKGTRAVLNLIYRN